MADQSATTASVAPVEQQATSYYFPIWIKILGGIAAVYLLRKMLDTRSASSNPGRRLSISDIEQWIDNDEGLYDWWKSSRLGKRKFIKENRAELEAAIRKVLGGDRPAHFLKYGPIRYEGTNPRRRSRKGKRK